MLRLAFDTNILIYAIEHNSEKAKIAASFVEQFGSKIDGLASELIFTELLSNPKLSDKDAQGLHELALQLNFTVAAVDSSVLLQAAAIRRRYGIKTPDAIHLATAVLNRSDYFVTNDKALYNLKIAHVKLVNLDDVKTMLVAQDLVEEDREALENLSQR